jgi:hypothetical protein
LKVESGGAVRERVLEREGVIRTKRGSAGGGAEQVIAKIKPMRHAIPKQLKELERRRSFCPPFSAFEGVAVSKGTCYSSSHDRSF